MLWNVGGDPHLFFFFLHHFYLPPPKVKGGCFHPSLCLFGTCENRRFFKYIAWLRALFYLSVCRYPRRRRGYCIWVRLFVCLFVCPHRTFVFFSATASRIETKFSPSATTHVECFIDNYDIIGHVLWQPCWKNVKNLDHHLWNRTKEKIWNLTHGTYSMGNECDFLNYFYDVIGAFVMTL